MAVINQVRMSFSSLSENVALARVTSASFSSQVDLTLNELEEIKVAISEAVSNAVIHAYKQKEGIIDMVMTLYDDRIEYVITDFGKGIEDIALARQPAYSTDPERMGLGFVFMESFMDELEIISELDKGTTVKMSKKINVNNAH